MMYGGAANNDVAQNDLRTFATTSYSPFWKAETVSTGTQYDRAEHSVSYVGGEEAALFGGKRASGTYLANLQFAYRSDITDSDQRWVLSEPSVSGPPSPRWKHGAAEVTFTPPRQGFKDKAMLIFGGQDSVNQFSGGTPRNDVRLLEYKTTAPQGWQWTELVPTGNAPSPRFGHVTVFDRGLGLGTADSSRLLVFGGRNNDGLLDNAVYALRLGTSPPSWYVAIDSTADTTAAPSKREGHVAVFDPVARPPGPTQKRQMVLFGGRDSAGALLNDTWVLQRPYNSTTYSWKKLSPAGRPAARTEAAAYYDDKRERLVVIGGDDNGPTSGGKRDDVWGLPLAATQSADSAWKQSPSMGGLGSRAGHGVAFIPLKPVKNRLIQRLVPTAATGQQWKTLHWAPKLMPVTYPFMFVLPNGHVAWAGPNVATGCPSCSNNVTMLLNPDSTAANRGWQSTTWSNGGFWGGGAVMYSAGTDSVFILRAGGHYDYEGTSDVTQMIAFSAGGGSGGWRRIASGSGALTTRKSHNLTVLPTGEVLVNGGRGVGTRSKPQIWSPVTRLWSAELAEEPRVRNRHSTAVLLPDGRVLSAGGSNESTADALDDTMGTVYEPPYLFKSDGSYSTRPPLSGNPQRVRYGAQFSACTSASDSISTACLIRPGATTHGFNQDQRYVPLTFTPANFPTSRVTVTAPADSFRAPPGDYMLFLVNKKGVPSVARWVRLGYAWSEGDITRPARITDLATDLVTCNSVSLYWTAIGDDGATGVASYAELRRSTSPIDSSNFGDATLVSSQPVPVCPGTLQFHNVTGLSHNTTYYFAIKFSDESGNVSLFGGTASATTLDDCGVGARAVLAREGGASATGARDSEGTRGASPLGATATGSASGGGSPVVIEVVPQAGGLDVKVRPVADGTVEGDAQGGSSGVLLLTRDESGQWTTQGQHDLPPGNGLALPAPDRATRWVFLEPLKTERVLAEVGPGWIMDEARHSSEGDVMDALVSGVTPPMSVGDTLSVHYDVAEGVSNAPSWLIVMGRPSSSVVSTRGGSRRQDGSVGVPRVFALHQNLPNPFEASTSIRFAVPVASRVRLDVYDLMGRRVQTLANAFFPPGEHQVEWNRRTASGSLASPGLYFYRMDAGHFREKRRMVILP